MTTTNLPARRATTAVAVRPEPSPPQATVPAKPTRRHIGFIEVLVTALITAFFAGLMLGLTTT